MEAKNFVFYTARTLFSVEKFPLHLAFYIPYLELRFYPNTMATVCQHHSYAVSNNFSSQFSFVLLVDWR